MKQFSRTKLALRALAVASLFLLSAGTTATAETVIQSYKADSPIQSGLIVALDASNASKVTVAPAKEPNRMFGVAVDPHNVPVSLNQGGNVYVATNGSYPVIVSDQNGVIKSGDYISLSGIDGIGAKVTNDQNFVLGRAASGFDGKHGVITGTQGGHSLGQISVNIAVGKNPLVQATAGEHVPSALRSIGQAIAGKPVSPVRLYLALLVFLISLVAGSSLLYSAIRATITSIGRNPLSRRSILRGLYQSVIISIGVFGLGVLGVYLLLKL